MVLASKDFINSITCGADAAAKTIIIDSGLMSIVITALICIYIILILRHDTIKSPITKLLKLLLITFVTVFISCELHKKYISNFISNSSMINLQRGGGFDLNPNDINLAQRSDDITNTLQTNINNLRTNYTPSNTMQMIAPPQQILPQQPLQNQTISTMPQMLPQMLPQQTVLQPQPITTQFNPITPQQ